MKNKQLNNQEENIYAQAKPNETSLVSDRKWTRLILQLPGLGWGINVLQRENPCIKACNFTDGYKQADQ